MINRRTTAAVVGVLVVYLLFAIFIYGAQNPLSATSMPGGGSGDPAQMTWFLAWTPFALAHGHNLLSTTYLDVPRTVDLSDNTSVPVLGLLAAPITHVLGPIASLNALLRLALFFSASSMFFVLRRYCQSITACFLGGLLYGFGPFLVAEGQSNAHLNLLFLPIPPLLLWCADAMLFDREHRRLVLSAVFGLLCAVQLLIAPEVLSDCAVLAIVFVVVVSVCKPRSLRRALSYVAPRILVAAVVFLIVAFLPLRELFSGQGHVSGPVQPSAHLQSIANDLLTPLLPTGRQLLSPLVFTDVSRAFAAHLAPEQGGYLGITLIVAIVAIVIGLRHERIIQAAAALGILSFVLSLGAHLRVDNHLTSIPLPEAVMEHLPLFNSTVPARFSLETMLVVALILAVGLDRAIRAVTEQFLGRSRHYRLAAIGAASALVLVPVVPRLPFVTKTVPWSTSMTTYIAANVSPDAAVLTYPYPSPPFSQPMLWQAEAHMAYRLSGGYVTVQGANGAGQYWPSLLSPNDVQEYLSTKEAGKHSHYPASETLTKQSLCNFIDRYGISSVVAWDKAPNAAVVEGLFRTDLGKPVADGNSVMIWTTSGTRGTCAH